MSVDYYFKEKKIYILGPRLERRSQLVLRPSLYLLALYTVFLCIIYQLYEVKCSLLWHRGRVIVSHTEVEGPIPAGRIRANPAS